MKLYAVAPVRVHFSLDNSESVFKSGSFFNFWKDVKKNSSLYEDFECLEFCQLEKNINLYNDSSYDSLEKNEKRVFGIFFTKIANNIIKNYNGKQKDLIDKFIDSVESFELQFFDNTIGIVDMKLNLKDISSEDNLEFTNSCEAVAKKIVNKVLNSSKDKITTFLNKIEKIDENNIIQEKNSYLDFIDYNKEDIDLKVMWLSSALVFEKGDSKKSNVLDNWLNNAVSKDKIIEIKNDESAYSLDWIRYAFREKVQNIDKLWYMMFLAQYYYAVVDVIRYNLRIIINQSQKKESKKFCLKNLLKKAAVIDTMKHFENISSTTNIHLVEYYSTLKHLNHNDFIVFNNILNKWRFKDILANTEQLIDMVKENINSIYNKISSKNNFYTDILLTAIGFFAIINLVISLNQYSRAYTSDAMISSRGNEQNEILFYIATIPTDSFLTIGFFSSVFLLFIYFVYRKKILP